MRSRTSGKVLSRLGLANTAVAGASAGGDAGEALNAGGEGGALSPH